MEMVFELQERKPIDRLLNLPTQPSVVEVFVSKFYNDYYVIIGYEYDKTGREQHFHKRHFRPLSDVLAEISIAELVEEVVEC